MTKIAISLSIAGCVSLSACSTYEMTYRPDGSMPDPSASYAIVHIENGHANLSTIICDALSARGIAASIVADADFAGPSQSIVRYESSWMWDVAWFLHMVTIGFYDLPDNNLQAATLVGRTSTVRNLPRKVVETGLAPMFGTRAPDALAAPGSCKMPAEARDE